MKNAGLKREPLMSRRAVTILLFFLTAANVIALAINVSATSRAAVAGVGYRELMNDVDFTRAVKSIVERCSVNVDLARISKGADRLALEIQPAAGGGSSLRRPR